MSTAADYRHIVIDQAGAARLDDTQCKVASREELRSRVTYLPLS